MLEDLVYPIMGFAFTYLGLETAWHFTACKVKDAKIHPCVFKEVKVLIAPNRI